MSSKSIISSALKRNPALTRQPANSTASLNARPFPIQLASLITIISDFIVICLSAQLAKFAYIDLVLGTNEPNSKYILLSIVGSILCVLIFNARKHYTYNILKFEASAIPRILRATIFAFLMLLFIGFCLKVTDNYSRIWFLLWFLTSVGLVPLSRTLLAKLITDTFSSQMFKERVAILGDGPQVENLYLELNTNNLNRASVKHYTIGNNHLETNEPSEFYGGTLNDLIRDGWDEGFDRIIIALPQSQEANVPQLIKALAILPFDIQICPQQLELGMLRPSLEYQGNCMLFNVHRKPITKLGSALKTILDYSISVPMTILLLPVFLLIAIAIKLDSRGPVFFTQRRHGFNHSPIDVKKFRTMSVMEDGDVIPQATLNDERITRVGKFLRKTSLDELPQLYNVIKGEMSLVGPRPHALAHNEYYSHRLEDYAERHKVKPGITGWAQINGHRGLTDTLEKMKNRADADIYYIENWSIWFDLKILFVSIFIIPFQKNAH